jgi:hypothetical protein
MSDYFLNMFQIVRGSYVKNWECKCSVNLFTGYRGLQYLSNFVLWKYSKWGGRGMGGRATGRVKLEM